MFARIWLFEKLYTDEVDGKSKSTAVILKYDR